MLKKLQAVELTGKTPDQVKNYGSILAKAQGLLKGLPAAKGVGKKAIGDVNKILKKCAKSDLEKPLAAQVATSLRDLENAFEGVAKWGYFVETRLGEASVFTKNVQYTTGRGPKAEKPVVSFGPSTTKQWLLELNMVEKAGTNCRKEYNNWAKAVKSAARDQDSIKKIIGVSKSLGSNKKSIKRLEELENTYKKSCNRLDNAVKSRMVLMKGMKIV